MMPGDPVVGSTVLRRPAIQSPNFVTGVSGWTVNADGSAEFNNLTIRGTFNGTDFIINANGAFFYSGAPALGNLIASIAPAAGTDGFGNTYQQGIASYVATGGNTYALQLGAQVIGGVTAPAFWIQNLTSPASTPPAYSATQAGAAGSGCEIYSGKSLAGSTPAVVAVEDSTESGIAGGLVQLLAGETDVSGNLVVTGTLSVGGTDQTSTVGLPNGGIQGTSGAASAGTAHTHGPGSYSVTNGQHHHTL